MIIIGSFTIIFSSGISYYSINRYKLELFLSMESQIKDTPQETIKDGEDSTTGEEKTAEGDNKRENNVPIVNVDLCVVSVSEDGTITFLTNDLSLSEDDVQLLVDKVKKDTRKEGKLKENNLLFCTNMTQDGFKIVFVEEKYLTNKIVSVCLTSTIVAILFLTTIFFISLWVANLAVKPVEKSLDEQKRFIADASHELKTPLSVISANNKIIEKTATPQQKEWVESSNDEIKYMSNIIAEMLTLAQTENITTVNKMKVNLSKLATSLCLQFEPVSYEKNLSLEQKIDNDIIVNFDEKMLRQLVMILLDNAIKHESGGGKIILSVEKKSATTILKVTNLKTLIPKEKIAHLFERFYKVDESRTGEGFGLGLAIAKNIVDSNGSTIAVLSNEQCGTTFEVRIPN